MNYWEILEDRDDYGRGGFGMRESDEVEKAFPFLFHFSTNEYGVYHVGHDKQEYTKQEIFSYSP